MTANLTLGPILFHWDADKKRDFYARVADEAPVEVIYLGEVICSKRSPFFERHYPEVIERLERAENASCCLLSLKSSCRASGG